MVDILFLNPKDEYRKFNVMMPLGILSLASYLEDNRFSVKLVDFDVEELTVNYVLKKHTPKIVCISGTTASRFESFKIASLVKKYNSEILVVYGGTHASFTINDTLKNVPEIDLIVRGEGEKILLDVVSAFLHNKSWKSVSGISYENKGRIISNNVPRFINLDNIDLNYDLIDFGKYKFKIDFVDVPAMNFMMTRGCPFKCTFCSASKMWGCTYRKKSVDKSIYDLKFLVDDLGYKAIKFFDSTLTADKLFMKSFLKEVRNSELKFEWECESRIDVLSIDLLSEMKRNGCRVVDLGLESANQRILNSIDKKVTPSMARSALIKTKSVDVKSKMFFMYGLPTETLNEATDTLKFIKQNWDNIDKVAAGVCTIYPGTEVEQFAKNKGYLPADFSWSEKYNEDRYIRDFDANPLVPKLIQPQLGYDLLKQLFDESYKEPLSLDLIKKKIKDIGTDRGLNYSFKEAIKSLKFKFNK